MLRGEVRDCSILLLDMTGLDGEESLDTNVVMRYNRVTTYDYSQEVQSERRDAGEVGGVGGVSLLPA